VNGDPSSEMFSTVMTRPYDAPVSITIHFGEHVALQQTLHLAASVMICGQSTQARDIHSDYVIRKLARIASSMTMGGS
jgi:hypothetical protein